MQVAAFLPAAPSAPAGVAPSSSPFSSASGADAAAENSSEFAGGFESLLDSKSGSPRQDGPELAPPKPLAPPPCEAPVVQPTPEPLAVTASAMLLQMPAPVPVAPPPPVVEPASAFSEAAPPAVIECTEPEMLGLPESPLPNATMPVPTRGRPDALPLGQNSSSANNPEADSTATAPTRGRPKDLPAPVATVPATVRGHPANNCGDSIEAPVDAPATAPDAGQSTPTVRGGVRPNLGGVPTPVVTDQAPATEKTEPQGPNENANAAATTAPTRGRPPGRALGLVNGTANPRAETRSAVTRGTPIPLEEATETISSEAASEPVGEAPTPVVPQNQTESSLPPTAEPATRGRPTLTEPRESLGPVVSAEVPAPKPEGRGRPVPMAPDAIVPAHGETVTLRSPGRGVPEALEALRVNAAPAVRALENAAVQFSGEVTELETPSTEAVDAAAPAPGAEPELPVASEEAPLLRVTGFHVERSRIRVTERAPAPVTGRQLTAWPTEKNSAATAGAPLPLSVPAETPAPTAAAALLSAAPTLVQLSVDAAVVNRAVPTLKPSESEEASEAPVAFDDEEYPVETITIVLPEAAARADGEAGKDSATRPMPEAKAERIAPAVAQAATPRENPAAGRGKNAATPGVAGRFEDSKNFLNVDKQEVVREPREIGTRIAEGRPAMAASTLLPSAPETATHETGSLLPVGTGRPTFERSSGTGSAEAPQLRSYAAAAVREVMAAAEKVVPPRTTIELRLQAFDQENVRVQLVWRDGTIHARFVTETPELQHALNREWDSSMPRFAEKGLKFSEASFEHRESAGQGGTSHGAFSSEQHGRGRRSFTDQEFPEFAVPAFLSAVTGRAMSVPVDLPSMATAMQPMAVAPRGLRVWA